MNDGNHKTESEASSPQERDGVPKIEPYPGLRPADEEAFVHSFGASVVLILFAFLLVGAFAFGVLKLILVLSSQ